MTSLGCNFVERQLSITVNIIIIFYFYGGVSISKFHSFFYKISNIDIPLLFHYRFPTLVAPPSLPLRLELNRVMCEINFSYMFLVLLGSFLTNSRSILRVLRSNLVGSKYEEIV